MGRGEPRLPVAAARAEEPCLSDVPHFVLLERQVEEEFRPVMLEALQRKVETFAESNQKRPVCSCNKLMTNKGARDVSWLCRFGRIEVSAVRFECKKCKRYNRPLLQALGVEVGRVCGSLARLLAVLGTVVPYQLAAELAAVLLGVRVNAMTVWRAVQRLGGATKRYNDAMSHYYADSRSETVEKADAPQAIVLGVDGCMLGMQVRKHRRHRKSKQENLPPLPPVPDDRFHEVKTGLLLLPSERLETSPGRRSVLRRVLVTCLGDADELFNHLWAQMQTLGWLGKRTMIVIVGDGADWIWNRASWFKNRCEILDFWHAIERAWEFARLWHGDGSRKTARWIHQISTDLRAGKVKKVLIRLKKISPATREIKEKLNSLIGYYTNNAGRMHYDHYLQMGYGIGSGAVESAHKQVVHARFRQAGMRWSEAGAQKLLALRLLLLNRQWDQLYHLRMAA